MRVHQLLPIAALSFAMSALVAGQAIPEVKLPPSPQGQAAVQLGGTWEKTAEGPRYRDGKWVVVDYGRPLLRGRTDIFGNGASYGKLVNPDSDVWRAGANDTTRLTTQIPLQVAGKTLPPGKYSVFVDLKPDTWTMVLSTQAVQEKYDPNEKVKLYGSYNHDPKVDLMRAPMTVKTTDTSVEQFTIAFVDASATGATLTRAWDKTIASVPFTAGK
jgi:hypothetical protein